MTILVAVDFSPVTARTIEAVRRFAAPGVRVVIVHAAEPDPAFVGWDAGTEGVRHQVADEFRRQRADVEALASDLRAAGIDAIGLTVQGPIVETIVSEAGRVEADLIAIGSHGHGATYDLVVGSNSAGVIRRSPVPVLVVPDRSNARPVT